MSAIHNFATALAVTGLVACGANPAVTEADQADATAALDTTAATDTAAPDDAAADTAAIADTAATDTAGPPDALGPLAIALDDLCEPLAAGLCRIYVGCRAATSSASVAACREHTEATCQLGLDRARAQVAAGTVDYDADAAHACLTRVDLVACGPIDAMLDEVGAECHGVFVGTLAADAPCTDADDCAPGLYCAPDARGACPGSCQPPPVAGETCDNRFAPCAAGSLCDLGVCVPEQVALDAPCAFGDQCPTSAFCAEDEEPARCRARRPAGADCDDDEVCAEGLFCAIVDFADAGSCAAKLERDAVCTPLLLGAQCADGQACDSAAERCVDRPHQAGDPCVEGWEACGVAGLYCDVTSDTCEALPRQGEGCGLGGATTCQYGWCDAADGAAAGQCQTFAAPGAVCADARECGGLDCIEGSCGLAADTACHPDRRGLALGTGYELF